MRPWPALVAVAVAAAGCGTPSADLFVVERSGSLPAAKLKLVVGDGGEVSCDGTDRPITSAQLLRAREIARTIEPLLERRVDLPPGPQSLLRFRVVGEQGAVRFSDSSRRLPTVFAQVLQFTRDVSMQSCGNPR